MFHGEFFCPHPGEGGAPGFESESEGKFHRMDPGLRRGDGPRVTGWSVLLSDPAGAEVGALARFFAADKKVPMIDALRLARRSWGFLGRDLDESAANALVQSAAAVGIKAMAVETKAVPNLSEPVGAHGAIFEGNQMTLAVGIPATPHTLALETIRLLSVAHLRRDMFVTRTTKEDVSTGRRIAGLGILLATGIPVGLGKAKEIQKTTAETEWVLMLDIYGDEGRWRAIATGFDFSGLGSEKGAVGPDNLRRLLALLHRRAPSALLNRGARWWLEGRPLNTAGYDEMSDVDQESRWLLSLAKRR